MHLNHADITRIPDFDDINDKTVADFFNFNEMERLWIKKITKKNYSTF